MKALREQSILDALRPEFARIFSGFDAAREHATVDWAGSMIAMLSDMRTIGAQKGLHPVLQILLDEDGQWRAISKVFEIDGEARKLVYVCTGQGKTPFKAIFDLSIRIGEHQNATMQ